MYICVVSVGIEIVVIFLLFYKLMVFLVEIGFIKFIYYFVFRFIKLNDFSYFVKYIEI